MSIEVKDFDMRISDEAVKVDMEIIRDTLLQIKAMLDDHETRIEALEP